MVVLREVRKVPVAVVTVSDSEQICCIAKVMGEQIALLSVFPSRDLALSRVVIRHGRRSACKDSQARSQRSRTTCRLVREEDTQCSVLLGKRGLFVIS